MSVLKNNGIMLVLSSPSGAGKTTISTLLTEREPRLVRSISATTRAPRLQEIHGKDYFFVNESEFHTLCHTGKMLEYAKVFDNYYGIPKSFVEENLEKGTSVLFSIDWQGAFSLMQNMNHHVVSVFILPPSMAELKLRLYQRADQTPEVINSRLSEAYFEMSHCHKYNYVIVNDDLETSVAQIQAILAAECLRITRCRNLSDFLQHMKNENN